MITKRLAALFAAIIMLVSVLPAARANTAEGPVRADDSYYTDNGYSVSALLAESGDTLKTDLANLMTNTHSHVTTYSEIRYMFTGSDADPAVPGNILLCYSGASVNGAWDSGTTYNREHVWPKSKGTFTDSNAGADLHHIRPESSTVNSPRSNFDAGWIDTALRELVYDNAGTQNYVLPASDLFEPRDGFKGDLARIYFYVAVRWGEDLTAPVADDTFKTLLEWNLLDPVDSLEIARNEYVYSVQGNRNVFIDYPEFARLVYGSSDNGFDYTLLTDGDYCYYVENGSAVIASYSGSASAVTVPETLGGYTVSAIGCAAFANNPRLTSVTIPACVTKIGSYAFYNDTSLASVTIGSGSKTFARRAFHNVPALTAMYFEGQAPSFEAEGSTQIMIAGSSDAQAPSGFKMYYVSGQSGWTSGTWTAANGAYAYATATYVPGEEPVVTAVPDPTATPEATATPDPTEAPDGEVFTLVTSLDDVTSGDYVLYGVNGNYKGAMNNTCSGGHMGLTAVTVTGDTIVSPDASIIWSMQEPDGVWTLYNEAVQKYCMISTNSTGGFSLGDKAEYGYTISAAPTAGSYYMTTTLSGSSRMISIYQNDFRPYASSNWHDLYLYKRGGEAPDPTATPEPTVTPEPTATPEPTPEPTPAVPGDYVLVTSLDDVTPGKYVLYGVNGNYVGAMSSVCNKGHMLAAEVTLSGIVLDTQSFSIRTGERTYAAASWLRRCGADPAAVKKLFKNDMDTTVARNKLMQNAKLYRGVAVVITDEVQERIVLAQAADELAQAAKELASPNIMIVPGFLHGKDVDILKETMTDKDKLFTFFDSNKEVKKIK